MRFLLLICLSVSLSSCSAFQQDNYSTFGGMYESHEENEYWRITEQAEAIARVAENSTFSTPVEAALFKVIAVQSIERIVKERFSVDAPTTGYDVIDTVAGGLPMAILGLTSYGISKKGYQYGGSTTVTAESMTLKDSLNRNDISVIGEGNGLSVPGRIDNITDVQSVP